MGHQTVSSRYTRTFIQDAVPENSSVHITASVVDDAGTLIPTLTTLSLLVRAGAEILRARGDILSSFSAGAIDLHLASGDAAIVDDELDVEWHVALFEWTWDSGAKSGSMEVWFPVQNFAQVPVV